MYYTRFSDYQFEFCYSVFSESYNDTARAQLQSVVPVDHESEFQSFMLNDRKTENGNPNIMDHNNYRVFWVKCAVAAPGGG